MERVPKQTKEKSKLQKIQNEYNLKRNNFNPQKSPNLFMNKLRVRMKCYYNELNKSYSSIME
uniref:Uncharacterized protein n=1 Tax=viral metagenome TaxID=1070528 RepID=A0A6C0CNK5_9ZZZZ